MSVSRVLMKEQLEMLERQIAMIQRQIDELPRGSIVMKTVRNKKYPYRVYRSKQNVFTIYVKKCELENIKLKIKRRKVLENQLRDLKKEKKAIEAFLKMLKL